jgi:hypothetical protein
VVIVTKKEVGRKYNEGIRREQKDFAVERSDYSTYVRMMRGGSLLRCGIHWGRWWRLRVW